MCGYNRGARGIDVLWVDELVDLPARGAESGHILAHLEHEPVDAVNMALWAWPQGLCEDAIFDAFSCGL